MGRMFVVSVIVFIALYSHVSYSSAQDSRKTVHVMRAALAQFKMLNLDEREALMTAHRSYRPENGHETRGPLVFEIRVLETIDLNLNCPGLAPEVMDEFRRPFYGNKNLK